MNKLATLIATSILGLSSVAAAQPAIDFHARATVNLSLGTPALVVRDHRYERPVRPRPAPIKIWEPVRRPPPMTVLNLGTVSTGKQTLKPPADAHFDSLVLDIDGIVNLRQVAVFFTNGQLQLARFDAVYTGRMASPVIDLAGTDRSIKRVIVYTADDQRGEITVLGRDDNRAPALDPWTRWAKLGVVATGKQYLELDAGRFDRLALAATGRVHLKQVLIRFADGTEQLAKLDVILVPGTRAPIIELAGSDRMIKSVIVYTANDQRGELTLYAI